MPWSVAVTLVVLGPLGLLSAYLGLGIAPALLVGALLVVLLRGIQARWLPREELQGARAEAERLEQGTAKGSGGDRPQRVFRSAVRRGPAGRLALTNGRARSSHGNRRGGLQRVFLKDQC